MVYFVTLKRKEQVNAGSVWAVNYVIQTWLIDNAIAASNGMHVMLQSAHWI